MLRTKHPGSWPESWDRGIADTSELQVSASSAPETQTTIRQMVADRLELVPVGEPAALQLLDKMQANLRNAYLKLQAKDSPYPGVFRETIELWALVVSESPMHSLRHHLNLALGFTYPLSWPPVRMGMVPSSHQHTDYDLLNLLTLCHHVTEECGMTTPAQNLLRDMAGLSIPGSAAFEVLAGVEEKLGLFYDDEMEEDSDRGELNPSNTMMDSITKGLAQLLDIVYLELDTYSSLHRWAVADKRFGKLTGSVETVNPQGRMLLVDG